MAKYQPVETLGKLLEDVIRERRLTAWCRAAGVSPYTVARLLDGKRVAVRRATVLALAEALRLPVDRLKAAIEATRKAAS